MKVSTYKHSLLAILLLWAPRIFAQCNTNDVQYIITQPTVVGGTGSITFYTSQPGYYIMNTRDYSTQVPAYTGAWPGTAGSCTFNNLATGTYTFVLLKPTTAPGNPGNPGLTDDFFCSQYMIDIKVTSVPPFVVTASTATNCSSTNGTITISGLPFINSYGVRFPTQTGFTQTFGAASITSPAGLSLPPGNYTVQVTEHFSLAGSPVYNLPIAIASATGSCAVAAPPNLTVSANNTSNCTNTDATITVAGIPASSGPVYYGVRFPGQTTYQALGSGNTSINASNYGQGNYIVEVVQDAANPTTSTKYTLPIVVVSNTGACATGLTYNLTTTNGTNCTSNNGGFTVSGLFGGNPPNGVRFPGEGSWNGVSSTGSRSSNTDFAPGNYAIFINDSAWTSTSAVYMLSAVMGAASGTCTPRFTATSTNTTNCSSTNGTITVSGLPTSNSWGVKFPGQSSYTQTNGTATTMTSPSGLSLPPGEYYVVVNSNYYYTPGGRDYYVPVRINATSGVCTVATITATGINASNCAANNGRIRINGLPTNQAYGVRFPGTNTYVMPQNGATTLLSPTKLSLPPGTYTVEVKANVYNAASTSVNLSVTIGTGGTCPPPSTAFTITTTAATDCFTANGRITVAGFTNGDIVSVRFPGYTPWLMMNSGVSSLSSPIGLALLPGNYTLQIRTNAFSTSSTVYNYPVTITSASGVCDAVAPSLIASTTAATTCSSSDGRITIGGFKANQLYGVRFPGQRNFMVPMPGETTVTSPPGLALSAGNQQVAISSNIRNANAGISFMNIMLPSATGLCVPVVPVGFGDEPICGTYEDTVFTENYSSSNTTPIYTANGNLPAGYVTDYTKVNLGCDAPNDGYLAVVNTTNLTGAGCPSTHNNRVFSNFQHTTDHTSAGQGGYFLLVNGSYNPGKIFERTIAGLCPGSTYNFSVWVKDLLPYSYGNVYNFTPIRPALSFWIDDVEMDRDTVMSAAGVTEPATTVWTKVGFRFIASSSGLAKFTIRNNSPGGIGNDFAIDDITISKCMPTTTLTAPLSCNTGSLWLHVYLNQGNVASPLLRWLRNGTPISGWIASPYAPYIYSGAYSSGDIFTVELAEWGNTTDAGCRFTGTDFPLWHAGGGCVVLAANGFSIAGQAKGAYNALNWQYQQNSAVANYQLFYSTDGVQFEAVTTMASLTNNNRYQYLHAATGGNTHFYKVLALGKNGSRTWSPVSKINNTAKSNTAIVQLLNNRLQKNMSMQWMAAKPLGKVQVQVMDLSGKTVYSTTGQWYEGMNTTGNVASLPGGMYLVVAHTAVGSFTYRIQLLP